ncbi:MULTISPECIES: autoinducer binding domain-containing protein [unclassified Pseudomonas]|uniref:autoinducer binding domain-containing protein n=1 Tax=unclassified Pseudomonas TaxID=196821 RepID=UPI000BD9695A|nr:MULTISPECIES: autoinducer binding domain-containing protein [unclassified Pseudomonas]PVZ13880.1 LuxR family quorum-sensing transcriptional regulator LasR [Pseudomonas sp. URIL14HWK12:I12]PVZ24186.1 LuxR family quorum-sensing transcriptional regulator LasR [Pseudomonas sp. URIL14HWK12:I10]PVZ33175.1 LuxR family quorum-sensing transcriptional regulator LasR [Pseudomonas sp. URIL14HWK12:I11]SNZ10607.1 LuxR family transcriptional regulator, quorum-sensing transcription factor LasR [Pseudomonas 
MIGFAQELNELACATQPDEWLSLLQRAATNMGASGFLIALKPNKAADNSAAVIHSNFRSAWRAQYDAHAYANIDPVVAHSLKNKFPIIWNDAIYRSSAEKNFSEEAAHHGLRQGFTLPIHEPQGEVGMLSLSYANHSPKAFAKDMEILLGRAILLRDFALGGAPRLLGTTAERPQLTEREREVLYWSAAGKTSWEIGVILSIASASVEFHFKNIRRKFGVSSRRLAVVRAIELGLITP